MMNKAVRIVRVEAGGKKDKKAKGEEQAMTEQRWNEEEMRRPCGAEGHLDPEYDFEGLSLAYKQVQDSADDWKRRS